MPDTRKNRVASHSEIEDKVLRRNRVADHSKIEQEAIGRNRITGHFEGREGIKDVNGDIFEVSFLDWGITKCNKQKNETLTHK